MLLYGGVAAVLMERSDLEPFVKTSASLAAAGGRLYTLMKLVALAKLGNLPALSAPLSRYLDLVGRVGGRSC